MHNHGIDFISSPRTWIDFPPEPAYLEVHAEMPPGKHSNPRLACILGEPRVDQPVLLGCRCLTKSSSSCGRQSSNIATDGWDAQTWRGTASDVTRLYRQTSPVSTPDITTSLVLCPVGILGALQS